MRAASQRYRERNREYVRAYNREWMRAHPERAREYKKREREKLGKEGIRLLRIRKVYGLTEADISAMRIAQGGVCAICRKRAPTVIDHDHETKKIRGLLCNLCNLGLGWLGDDANRLRLALEYLSKQ